MLQPECVAPTDSFGFGEPQAPAAAYTRKGTATWSDAPGSKKPEDFLALDKIERTKEKHFHLVVACGRRVAEIDVADPSTPDASASTKSNGSR